MQQHSAIPAIFLAITALATAAFPAAAEGDLSRPALRDARAVFETCETSNEATKTGASTADPLAACMAALGQVEAIYDALPSATVTDRSYRDIFRASLTLSILDADVTANGGLTRQGCTYARKYVSIASNAEIVDPGQRAELEDNKAFLEENFIPLCDQDFPE
nr:hypothetical protein [uncultured Hyphomonas sp.]